MNKLCCSQWNVYISIINKLYFINQSFNVIDKKMQVYFALLIYMLFDFINTCISKSLPNPLLAYVLKYHFLIKKLNNRSWTEFKTFTKINIYILNWHKANYNECTNIILLCRMYNILGLTVILWLAPSPAHSDWIVPRDWPWMTLTNREV